MQSQSCEKCQRVACSILHGDTLPYYFPKGCDICLQRVKIDEEITSLQGRLFELSNKRLELIQNLNVRHDRLITRLPLELVSQIFIFSTESNDVLRFCKGGRPFFWHPSILLSAVSKDWREVSLSILQLWTFITINLGTGHFNLHITEEMLRRSRALPLSISFMSSPIDKDNADYLKLLKVVKSHSNRWENVDFYCLSFDDLLEGLEDMPLLDNLRIDLQWTDHDFARSMK